MNWDPEVSEFKLQSLYYVHLWINSFGKCMNPLLLPVMIAALLQGWLWHYITHQSWYAIIQRNQTTNLCLINSIWLIAQAIESSVISVDTSKISLTLYKSWWKELLFEAVFHPRGKRIDKLRLSCQGVEISLLR